MHFAEVAADYSPLLECVRACVRIGRSKGTVDLVWRQQASVMADLRLIYMFAGHVSASCLPRFFVGSVW